jgi:cytochrome b561
MPFATQLVYLFCYVCALGYVLFGILQMVLPARALPVYRFFLGARRFSKAELVMARMTRWHWRFVGAAYIVFGMLICWALTVKLAGVLHGG